jgi:hypothetical protein
MTSNIVASISGLFVYKLHQGDLDLSFHFAEIIK